MKIACLCSTFNRPAQLAEVIESFLRQTYPARELVILDDAGQYDPAACDHLPGVKLVTTRHRFRTLGEKRNASAALPSPDCKAYAVWDDDDIYLPWHLEAMAAVFQAGYPWSLPAEVWIDRTTHLKRKNTGGLFHGSWGFTREAFLAVGGYPAMRSGQDPALAARFRHAGIKAVSPSELVMQTSQPCAISALAGPAQHQSTSDEDRQPSASGDFPSLVALPSYIYRWQTYPAARHISALGKDGYQRRGKEAIVPVERLTPCWSRDWAVLSPGPG
ncbi:MAG: glycosyltransferase family 2 protein [Thermogutta sp.]